MPKKLNFGEPEKGVEETPPPVSTERRARPMTFPSGEPATPPPPPRQPRTIAPPHSGEIIHQRAQRAQTLTDILVDRAKVQNPDVSGEIRGKIDTLLHHITTETLIEWGHLNLVPLQQASAIQAEIAAELQRIDAVGLLREATDVATKGPSLFDRLSGKKPEQYEIRLNAAKTALMALLTKTRTQRASYFPEVKDLHHDAVALTVTLGEFTDPTMANIANQRAKTLLQAHQTGTILLQVLDNTMQQCAQYIEQISSFMVVTMPNWKISQQK